MPKKEKLTMPASELGLLRFDVGVETGIKLSPGFVVGAAALFVLLELILTTFF